MEKPGWCEIDHFYTFSFFFLNFLFIYFWLCWVFIAVRGLLIVVASPVVEHGLFSSCGMWA